MRVLVLGSGVIGVTTAYYLARQGVDVTVIDRQPHAALETSHANAGQISPGYSTPWAAPGIPLKALKWLFQRHAPLSFRPDGSLFQIRWLAHMLNNCRPERYAINKERMLRLAEYSRDCLRDLRSLTGIHYEGRQRGTLQVFRTQAQLDAIARDTVVLAQAGVTYSILDRAAICRMEPGLHTMAGNLSGALHLPGDETGDCALFTRELAGICAAMGVRFCYNTSIEGLQCEGGRITGVSTSDGLLAADHCVLALGSYSRALLGPVKIDVPVYPMKGYSLTVPITNPDRAPMSTVMDETYKVAVTRFDNRIRVGGMAELCGFDLRLNPRRRATLEMVLSGLFPEAGDVARASFWTGLRPMTPDGTPIVGASRIGGLWLNTGHGTLGWTMAAGSGRLLADLMLGRQPQISPNGLDVERYDRESVPANRRAGRGRAPQPAL